MRVKQEESVIWLFFKIPLWIKISMESSWDLFIDMVFDRFIFKNHQITLFPCFTFIPGVRNYLNQWFFLLCTKQSTIKIEVQITNCEQYKLSLG